MDRIQYRIANIGEVLPAGGKVFTMLDISYVYMDIYLPALEAGKIKVGTDARIVLDAYPNSPIPAKVSFLASQAQFTPKTVETQSERDKLMFRIRVRIDPDRSRDHAAVRAQRIAGGRLRPRGSGRGLAQEPARRAMNGRGRSVAVLDSLTQIYGKVTALDGVTISIPADCMVGLIGPDGVGKSTLLGIIAGARQIQSGSATVLGGDISDCEAQGSGMSADRLHAPGLGEESLS